LPEEGNRLLEENRKGEAILVAIDSIARGVQGDLRGVTEGLSLLRAAGLEGVARRTALELMILERRG
jgi:putative component of toxin-antitoxin plasmid stabilization module